MDVRWNAQKLDTKYGGSLVNMPQHSSTSSGKSEKLSSKAELLPPALEAMVLLSVSMIQGRRPYRLISSFREAPLHKLHEST